ncbi:MAG TPA: redoxin domain-containing protein [Nitrospira sp.]|nr:redoxin domain-containing protein [Nitrospira sp.]
MFARIFTGTLIVLTGVLLTWAEVVAGVGMKAPDISNAIWLNSEPLRPADLKGKVVMVEFWTFGCSNCRHVEPYVKQWYQKYADQGFVVIGVHSPEFSHEQEVENVKRYIAEHDIRFPVPIDNDFSTWNKYGNRYWPAMYLVDKLGVIRFIQIGEGRYRETEESIRSLLAEKE